MQISNDSSDTREPLVKLLGVDLDQRGNVRAKFVDYQTSRVRLRAFYALPYRV